MSLLSYSGVTTKVRAMNGKLMKPEDYKKLIAVSSVQEYISFLKQKNAYEGIFAGVNVEDLHRGDVEKLLMNGIFHDFSRIYRFSNSDQREFLDLYFMRYELQMIKSCLRMIFDKRNPEMNLDLFQPFFLKHSKMNLSKMASSTTIDELIESLKGTIFFQPLSKLTVIDHPSMFDYEMQLDLFYFVTLYKSCQKHLRGNDLELIQSSLGVQIDLMNIQWIYRSKKYLQLSSADLHRIIIPIHYKLKQTQLKLLIETQSIQEFEQLLNTTYYGNKFASIENYSLEDAFDRLIEKLNQIDTRNHPYSIAIIKSYLFHKEKEVTQLTRVLECIRYGYSPKEIEQYLQTEV